MRLPLAAPLGALLVAMAIGIGDAGSARAQVTNEFYDFIGICDDCEPLAGPGTEVTGKLELLAGTFASDGPINSTDIVSFLFQIGALEFPFAGPFFQFGLGTTGTVGNFDATPSIEQIAFEDSSDPMQRFAVNFNVEQGRFFAAEVGGEILSGERPTSFLEGEPPAEEPTEPTEPQEPPQVTVVPEPAPASILAVAAALMGFARVRRMRARRARTAG